MPATAKGRKLALSFGAIDESVWVYLNGWLIGEHDNYTVHDNGMRTLGFSAKGHRFRGIAWDGHDLVRSSKPEAVPILKGNALTFKEIGKNIWNGNIQVRGHGVGKSSFISLSVATKYGPETANARV